MGSFHKRWQKTIRTNVHMMLHVATQDVTLNDLELDGCLRICADGELPAKVVKSLGSAMVRG